MKRSGINAVIIGEDFQTIAMNPHIGFCTMSTLWRKTDQIKHSVLTLTP
ncbi:hypothetical protein [Porcincola intestinalis]|nr:hypothetical protein [Porcincola intestinalis]